MLNELSYVELTEIQTALSFAIIEAERKIADKNIENLKSEFAAKTKAMFESFKTMEIKNV